MFQGLSLTVQCVPVNAIKLDDPKKVGGERSHERTAVSRSPKEEKTTTDHIWWRAIFYYGVFIPCKTPKALKLCPRPLRGADNHSPRRPPHPSRLAAGSLKARAGLPARLPPSCCQGKHLQRPASSSGACIRLSSGRLVKSLAQEKNTLGCVFKGLKVSTEVSTEDLDTDGSGGEKSTALFSPTQGISIYKKVHIYQKKKNQTPDFFL